MKETIIDRNGSCDGQYTEADEYPPAHAAELAEDARAVPLWAGRKPTPLLPAPDPKPKQKPRPALALFCYEGPDGPVGRWVSNVAAALARHQTPVHLFTRQPFGLEMPGVTAHAVGASDEGDLFARVQDFTSRACNAFLRQFPPGSDQVTLLGCEWSSVPVLSLLHGTRNAEMLLSLHSLERQRSDMALEISQEILAIEQSGLREARAVLLHQDLTAAIAKELVPECAAKLHSGLPEFPVHRFDSKLDPGAVKGRYNVGPVDPTILYIGDLDERHGPDMLLRSMPAVLKNNKQARLVLVGDGTLQWPLRVYARYLLLEHAVRLAGHVEGQALFELIQAADIVAVPSRAQTEWWPILAAWAAGRPVVATQQMAPGLGLENEENCVLIYPHESSCVWGLERLLYDPDLGRAIAKRGAEKIEARFGWSTVATRIEALMGAAKAQ
jgi:glycosyltransferase involved in cell wall biosynthesis